MARILVTGGAGFIGSHLVERLLGQDHEVMCLDNYFTGSKANLEHLRDNPRLELIRHDVVNPIMLEVDQIYHLACPASPVHYQYNPVKTIKTNVLGTLNMLGLAKRVKARILLASTSEIYGDPQVHPQTEDYWGNVNCIGLRSCYDEGKRVAETLMMDYHRQNRVDIRLPRIFNTFGPRMAINDGRVVSNFIVQALTGGEITIYGEGQQTRSFCYVSDLVEALMRLMNRPEVFDPVNLGNPDEFTIMESGQIKVMALIDTPSDPQPPPLPPDDPGAAAPGSIYPGPRELIGLAAHGRRWSRDCRRPFPILPRSSEAEGYQVVGTDQKLAGVAASTITDLMVFVNLGGSFGNDLNSWRQPIKIRLVPVFLACCPWPCCRSSARSAPGGQGDPGDRRRHRRPGRRRPGAVSGDRCPGNGQRRPARRSFWPISPKTMWSS